MKNRDERKVITAIISGDDIRVSVEGTRGEIGAVYSAITASIIKQSITNGITPERILVHLRAVVETALADVYDKFFSTGEISNAVKAGLLKNLILSLTPKDDEESEEEDYGEEDD